MRLLLLGKNGQIGWELQRSLSPLGEVIALGRADADLADAAQLRDAVTTAAPDVIVNAAAYTAVDQAESEPDRADRVNHRAVAELAQLAAKRGALLVHYSTDYVFDGRKSGAYVETDTPAPKNVYGRTKLASEEAIAASGARHLVFRTSWVHAGRGSNFIRTILRLAAERDTLRVVADQIGAPTSAALIADTTAQAIAANLASGTYHLTAAGETSWHGLAQFAIATARGAGVPIKASTIEPITTADYPTAAARPANSRLDTTKLCTALGVTLPDWRDGARQSVLQLMEKQAA